MIKTIGSMLVSLLLASAYSERVRAQDDARNARGIFTGEIKPVVYVSDVEKSAPFYRDVLGFDLEGYADKNGNPYYAEMSVAGVKFGLHEPASPDQTLNVGAQRLYFRVQDLAAQRSRVLAWGKDAGKIVETDWMDMFIVRDPDGNEIAFAVTDPERHSINPWTTMKPAAGGNKKTE